MIAGGRSRLLAGAVLAAVFLAGAVVGAAAYRYFEAGEAAAAVREDAGSGTRGGPPDRDDGPTSAMLEILREDVGVSDRQEERVRSILERREERAQEVFEGVRRRFHRWMDTTVARVKEVLDEEQAAAFDRRLKERIEERRRDDEGRGGGAGDEGPREPAPAPEEEADSAAARGPS